MFINGSLKILYIKWDGEFLPVGCLTSNSFNESVEMLDTTTRDNGGWKTSVPTMQSYNFSFDGLVINSNYEKGNDSVVSLDRLQLLKRNRTKIEWKCHDNDKIIEEKGFGYITEISDSANIDEFVSFSANVVGYGNITRIVYNKIYEIEDGKNNIIQDGENNNLTNQ